MVDIVKFGLIRNIADKNTELKDSMYPIDQKFIWTVKFKYEQKILIFAFGTVTDDSEIEINNPTAT